MGNYSFITEIEDKKTIFHEENALIRTAVTTKKVILKFRARIITLASIES